MARITAVMTSGMAVQIKVLTRLISVAASAGNRAAAISGFQNMINGCFACHAVYKDRVAAVLKK